MNMNWNETIVEVIGVMKAGENNKIAFTANKFGKYTATLRVADDSPLNVLARRSTFVFVDGIRQVDVDAIEKLQESDIITSKTRVVITGHLVRTPGKPGMNDMFNIKTLSIRPAKEDENITVNFDEALSKEEWQVIRKEKFGGTASVAPTAPTAPVAPF